MKTRILIALCMLCAFMLSACAKSDESTNRTASTSSPAASSTTPTAVLTSTERIGVPECDDFIAAYDACVSNKVPEAARAQYKASIEQWRTSWKTLANNPNTKASLAAACKQSAEQAKTSLASYNCTW